MSSNITYKFTAPKVQMYMGSFTMAMGILP